jgi:hypothetical protein
MAQDFDIRQFFRRAPRDGLKQYFGKFGVLEEFDWESLGVRNIDPLYEAWIALDEANQLKMGEDFSNLHILGSAVGKTAIIDEAVFHPNAETVAPALAKLPDPLSCAFWTYFERKELWNGAVFFSVADLKPKRSWRKRLNMPKLGRQPKKEDATALARAVSKVYMAREARGAHCVVHPYRRRNKEYYFAYPQDHPSTSSEYDDKGQWTKRPYNPAFEIIFIHDDDEQSLTIWHTGKMERTKDLQAAFAESVLGQPIPRDSEKDERVYDLEVFRDLKFKFNPNNALGINKVEVRKLALRILGEDKHTVRIELAPGTPPHVLHHRVQAAMSGIAPTMYKVASVGMQVTFELGPGEETPKTRSFDLSWPNSCSLDDDDRGQRIQRMLADHNIEPKRPTKDDDGDSKE